MGGEQIIKGLLSAEVATHSGMTVPAGKQVGQNMHAMTRQEFSAKIDIWVSLAEKKGVRLPGGETLKPTFFKSLFGLKRRVFQELYSCKRQKWVIQPDGSKEKKLLDAADEPMPEYVVRCVYFMDRLTSDQLIAEIRMQMPFFLETRNI